MNSSHARFPPCAEKRPPFPERPRISQLTDELAVRPEVAAHLGQILIRIGEGTKGVVKGWLLRGKDEVALPIAVSLHKEEAQHQVSSEIEKENAAGQRENMF